MKVIGITGGVGSGKSSILEFISDNYSSMIIKADDLAKSLCKKGECCYEPLVELLSEEVLDSNGEINNKKMAEYIFGDDTLREAVNSIIHPAVKCFILAKIDELNQEGKTDYFFIEAALLIEDGYKEIVDEMWYIYTEENVRRERLKSSRGYSDEKIDAIMASQLDDLEFFANSDYVIDNSGSPEDSIKKIRERLGEANG